MRRMSSCTSSGVEASSRIGRAVLTCAALFALGCGAGRDAQNPLPPAASVGDEPPPLAAPAQPLKQKYGSVIVHAYVRDAPVNGRVRFLDASHAQRSLPMEAATGEVVQLESGTQNVEVTLDASAGLLDRPTQRMEVFITPHQQAEANAHFPWSKVAFTVFVQGRRQAGLPIKLLRNGQVVAELRSGSAPQALSPGKYEAQVQVHGRSLSVDRFSLLEGATQNIPLQF
jgi:hypothetical protein